MLDEWQAQQRAQKEEGRKAKTEATAAIQGYRRSGLSEEETKLAALREQERMQKLNAEQQLHGYRGQLSEEEAKLAAQKQEELRRKQELELKLRNNGFVSAHDPTTRNLPLADNSGVVSALAAGYSSPSPLKQPQEYQQRPTSSSSNENCPQPDFTAAIEAVVVIPVVAVDNNDYTTTAVPGLPSIIPDTATHDASEATPRTTTPIIPPQQEPSSTVHHSTLMFMFGILTADDVDFSSPDHRHKLVKGYLARADQISKSIIVHNSNNDNDNNNCSSFESILSTLAYPVAKSIEKDHSRTDVYRTMVTVAISFSAPNEILAQSFQAEVVECIRLAISNGSFTKILDDQ